MNEARGYTENKMCLIDKTKIAGYCLAYKTKTIQNCLIHKTGEIYE